MKKKKIELEYHYFLIPSALTDVVTQLQLPEQSVHQLSKKSKIKCLLKKEHNTI